ncbi:MAG TPA: iron-containing alcohol dehydrogenase [Burkholderiales bacterium]|nr:iron-containing alcohol dehydrogenase [Burkholderiales bacterium]
MHEDVFEFPALERLVYGKPAAQALAAEAERIGARRVFLVVSGTMNRATDEVEKVRAALGDRYAGTYDRIPPFTPRSAVLEAARLARSAGVDLVVTFGGGSVTEGGKMVRLCLQHDITDVDGFDRFRAVTRPDGTRFMPRFEGPSIPQIAIPTTLSAGELTTGGGATDERVKRKFSHGGNPQMIPRTVIFDPAPSVHTPLWVWLSTGVRAIDHATEGLCSPLSNPISDGMYQHALKLLGSSLLKTKRNPADLDSRLESFYGIWLAIAGRHGGVEMGASHAIGHALGGSCGVPHGYTSCVMLPHVLRYNRAANAGRQQLVSEALGHPGEDAADVLENFIAGLGLPVRLSEVGIAPEQFSSIATTAMHDRALHANPVRITSPEQVLKILEAAA